MCDNKTGCKSEQLCRMAGRIGESIMLQKGSEHGAIRKTTKNKMRSLALCLAIVIFSLSTLTGCSSNEIELMTALTAANLKDLYSYEMDSTVGMSLNIDIKENSSSYYYDDMMAFRMVEAVLNGAGASIHTKVNANKDLSAIRQEMVMVPSILGGEMKSLTTGVWMDFNAKEPKESSFIVKMPAIAAAATAYTAGKEFFVLNFDELPTDEFDSTALFENFSTIQDSAKTMVGVMNACMLKFAAAMDTQTAYVQHIRPSTDRTGKSTTIYDVVITDAGLKELIRSFANDVDRDSMKAITKEMLLAVTEYLKEFQDTSYIYESIVDELEWVLEEYDTEFDEFYDGFVEVVNQFLVTFKNINLLGKNGIKVSIEISKDGYVIGSEGTVDISIDVKKISKAMGFGSSDGIQKVDIGFNFKNEMYHINQNIPVNIPELTAKNSVSFSDILTAQEERYGGYYGYDEYDFYVDEPFMPNQPDPKSIIGEMPIEEAVEEENRTDVLAEVDEEIVAAETTEADTEADEDESDEDKTAIRESIVQHMSVVFKPTTVMAD